MQKVFATTDCDTTQKGIFFDFLVQDISVEKDNRKIMFLPYDLQSLQNVFCKNADNAQTLVLPPIYTLQKAEA